jgi:hypothetical protein
MGRLIFPPLITKVNTQFGILTFPDKPLKAWIAAANIQIRFWRDMDTFTRFTLLNLTLLAAFH